MNQHSPNNRLSGNPKCSTAFANILTQQNEDSKICFAVPTRHTFGFELETSCCLFSRSRVLDLFHAAHFLVRSQIRMTLKVFLRVSIVGYVSASCPAACPCVRGFALLVVLIAPCKLSRILGCHTCCNAPQ